MTETNKKIIKQTKHQICMPVQIQQHRESMTICLISDIRHSMIIRNNWFKAHETVNFSFKKLIFVYDVCQHSDKINASLNFLLSYKKIEKKKTQKFLNPNLTKNGKTLKKLTRVSLI